ncbi:hypothetical protein VFPFJ_03869 [Purpureocillium lilacinum]|uniref:Uncharacterized protein n=1 Tax=Purpureocillium lilacinum TaxID=33203 RepID=A0A179HRS6_PURLI|nr:hypothetical protein VFPFJ_03869 [Purpureocillium lilacinum]OAQ92129.1 hypothetical protein VFPFJ_03869 [Purpureocillium lilacinum]
MAHLIMINAAYRPLSELHVGICARTLFAARDNSFTNGSRQCFATQSSARSLA